MFKCKMHIIIMDQWYSFSQNEMAMKHIAICFSRYLNHKDQRTKCK